MKKVVTFGEIMLRLAPQGFLRFSQATNFDVVYGGGESNVAVSLANYGIPVEFVTRIPKSEIGECALMELRKRGVGTSHIVLGGERLGIYFMETGAVNRSSNVVYDRTNSAMAELKSGMINWDKVFDGVSWFHWTGITPAISKNAADVCLEAVKIAKDTKFKIVSVTNRIDEHEANFAQDYLKIKDLALQEKQLNAVSKWQEEKIMDTYIKINGELRSCDFNSNWFKIK